MDKESGQKPIYKRWWFWLVGSLFVLFVIGSLSSPDPSEVAEEGVSTNTGAQAGTQPLTTIDSLWLAVDKGLDTRKGIEVAFDDATGRVTLTDTPANPYLDATMTVRHAQSDLVYLGQQAFKIEGVESLSVIVLGDFTDKFGNQIVDDAVRITIDKDQFQKYKWENLVGLSIEQQLAESTDEYYVHPAVLLEVNPSKLHLEVAP